MRRKRSGETERIYNVGTLGSMAKKDAACKRFDPISQIIGARKLVERIVDCAEQKNARSSRQRSENIHRQRQIALFQHFHTKHTGLARRKSERNKRTIDAFEQIGRVDSILHKRAYAADFVLSVLSDLGIVWRPGSILRAENALRKLNWKEPI